MDLDLGTTDVTAALNRLKGFSSSTSPTSQYQADASHLVAQFPTLGSLSIDPFEVQQRMFEVVTRALDITKELAVIEEASPSPALSGDTQAPTFSRSCEAEPPAKRRRLESEATSSPDDEASLAAVLCSTLAEDLRILARGAIESGISTLKRAGCAQQTARVVRDHIFVLLNHVAFGDDRTQHPVLQAALLQRLIHLKKELTGNYNSWSALTPQHGAQLLGIINLQNIHPVVMHAAATAVRTLIPYDVQQPWQQVCST